MLLSSATEEYGDLRGFTYLIGGLWAAMKVWGVKGDFYYLIDLIRDRLDYPTLKRKVIELSRTYYGATLLIEDAGSGISLIQDLWAENISAVPVTPQGDKVVRMSAQSAKIEAGRVYLEKDAPWLDELKSEILAFPYGTHDDQVDSISQALAWMSRPRRTLHFA